MKTTLLYVLRSGTSRELGFGDRDDGYVSVNRLVSFPFSFVIHLPQHFV